MPGVLCVDVEEEGCELCVAGDLSDEGEGFEEFLFGEFFVVFKAKEVVDFELGALRRCEVTWE